MSGEQAMTKELEEAKETVADFLEWNAPRPDLLRATGKEGDAIDAEYWDAAHQAIRALLSALSRGDGWEPIETAPKDTPVLLWAPGAAGPWWGYWHVCGEIDQRTNTGHDGWTDGSTNAFEELWVHPATHWRPLPLAPEGTQ